MPTVKTIKRCPSWNKVSGLLGEWSGFEHRNKALSPERANEIAANLIAVNLAARMGKNMPSDWSRGPRSMPYQLGAIADRILESELIRGANQLTTFDLELV